MKSIPEQYVEIWNTQKVQGLPHIFSESAFYKDALQEGNAIAMLSNSIEQTAKAFPNVSFETLSLTEGSSDDKLFILEWLMKGTNSGSFFGAEPTNKEIAISGVDLIQVKNERIVEIKSFYDSGQLVAQLEI